MKLKLFSAFSFNDSCKELTKADEKGLPPYKDNIFSLKYFFIQTPENDVLSAMYCFCDGFCGFVSALKTWM